MGQLKEGNKKMNAEIITVGKSLIWGGVNQNAGFITECLASVGIDVYFQSDTKENKTLLTDTLKHAFSRSEAVILCGGASFEGDNIITQSVFELFKIVLLPNKNAVYKIKEATGSKNANSIPDKKLVILLSSDDELKETFRDRIIPLLSGDSSIITESHILNIIGLSDAQVKAKINDYKEIENLTLISHEQDGEVFLSVGAKGEDAAEAEGFCRRVIRDLISKFGYAAYGVDKNNIEQAAVELLLSKNKKVAVAESCTAGLLSKKITDIPGSSAVFDMGVTAYSNDMKISQLNVPASVLEEFGAVSKETAAAMARGIRNITKADYSLAISGIAGPASDGTDKPVGLVYIAIADSEKSNIKELNLSEKLSREQIREIASKQALNLLRLFLLGDGDIGNAEVLTVIKHPLEKEEEPPAIIPPVIPPFADITDELSEEIVITEENDLQDEQAEEEQQAISDDVITDDPEEESSNENSEISEETDSADENDDGQTKITDLLETEQQDSQDQNGEDPFADIHVSKWTGNPSIITPFVPGAMNKDDFISEEEKEAMEWEGKLLLNFDESDEDRLHTPSEKPFSPLVNHDNTENGNVSFQEYMQDISEKTEEPASQKEPDNANTESEQAEGNEKASKWNYLDIITDDKETPSKDIQKTQQTDAGVDIFALGKKVQPVKQKKGNIFIRFIKYLFPWKGDPRREVIRKIVFFIALVVFVYALVSWLIPTYEDWVANNTVDIVTDKTPPWSNDFYKKQQMNPKFNDLYAENNDLIGKITFTDMKSDKDGKLIENPDSYKINYPVLQIKEKSKRDFYIDHDFYKKSNRNGAIWADWRNQLEWWQDDASKNITLYGHDMASGAMFGFLTHFKTKEQFAREHSIFTFDSLYRDGKFFVFSAMLADATPDDNGNLEFEYRYDDFSSDEQFMSFVEAAKARSLWDFDIDILPTDEIITLQTCINDFDNARLIVMGRRVRDNEPPTVKADQMKVNTNVVYPKAWYKKKGKTVPAHNFSWSPDNFHYVGNTIPANTDPTNILPTSVVTTTTEPTTTSTTTPPTTRSQATPTTRTPTAAPTNTPIQNNTQAPTNPPTAAPTAPPTNPPETDSE